MEIRCTNCGADVAIGERETTVECPYCDTGLFVQLTVGIPHLAMLRQVKKENLPLLVQRYLKELEITSAVEIESEKILYLPFWRFKTSGRKADYLVAASSPVCEDLGDLVQPGGEASPVQKYKLEHENLIEPEILAEEAASATELLETAVELDEEKLALVHIPVVEVHYRLEGETYTAYVEGVSGAVYSDEDPDSPQREKSRTLVLVAIVSFLLFLVQAYKVPTFFLLFTFPLTAVILYFMILHFMKRLGW